MSEQTPSSQDSPDTESENELSAALVETRSLLVSYEILGAGIRQQLLSVTVLGMALLCLAIPLVLPNRAPFSDWAVVHNGSVAISLIVVFGVASILMQSFRLLACRQSARIAMEALVSELKIAEQTVGDRSIAKRRSRTSGDRI